MNVVFFGMMGQFSIEPLKQLIEAKVTVSAIIIPKTGFNVGPFPQLIKPHQPPKSDLPIVNPYLNHTILHSAWANNIPIWEVNSLRSKHTLDVFTKLAPDLICVVCFPFIFPKTILNLPHYGCLNLHPSLLPAYRGPTPLFWLMKQGEKHTGVTLHFLDETLDTGDIISQAIFRVPEGITEKDLEYRCAEMGGHLLVTAIKQLQRKQKILPHRIQPTTGASYFPIPSGEDFCVPTTWSAQRAFNFLRGATSWPLFIKGKGFDVKVDTVLGYTLKQSLSTPYIYKNKSIKNNLNQNELWLQFKSGVLRIIPASTLQ